ncbi:Ger(x)C family spore germination C-terminal domain-containing protein [Caloramator sp. mosi_1]|nr:Ger(x)C family spore germination C-terminal domain-containing protein [Caloramator sp. mosi_1]WDC85555.1 Ger(x)C family spore germination C-terminal domain-containing protein [Caloramator sp. mosi_1]
MEEAVYVNMLRNSDVKGNISLVMEDYKSAVDVECITKRKVYVDKADGKLKYTIKLSLQGEIKLNTFNFNEENDVEKILDEIEVQLTNNLIENLNKIVERAKNDYEIDVFDIQKYAIAKYGRENEDKIRESFKDSEIEVVINTKIRSTGRYK